jgi:hypothetical protein
VAGIALSRKGDAPVAAVLTVEYKRNLLYLP